MRPRATWILYASVLLLLALGAIELRYYATARVFFHPPIKHVTEADRAKARELLPTLEEISFRASDGPLLRGFYVPSQNGAAVVLVHGLTQNRMDLVPTAAMLARHGYGALVFDLRAHGESEGDTSTFGDREQNDFEAAVDFVAARGDIRGGRIAALGFSIGATTVAVASSRDARVRAVILDAVYTSFEDEWQEKMGIHGELTMIPARLAAQRAGVDPSHLRPIDAVAQIAPRPVLFLAGTHDVDTPVAIVQKVYDAASEPKRLVVLDGVVHDSFPNASVDVYEREVIGFLEKSLLEAPVH